MPTNPIPAHLARGFRHAVDFYQSSWSPAVHGREVSINRKSYKIKQVCDLVSDYTGNLPDDLLVRLLDAMDLRYAKLKDDLAEHPTYRVAAICLRRLIDDAEREYWEHVSKV